MALSAAYLPIEMAIHGICGLSTDSCLVSGLFSGLFFFQCFWDGLENRKWEKAGEASKNRPTLPVLAALLQAGFNLFEIGQLAGIIVQPGILHHAILINNKGSPFGDSFEY